ncbi:MAG: DeoR/GlpR transcriptional regulator [Anaerolineae bacterium]|nr:DeoR/GlpR transcriptional regulator [Anaerolineae bacterium]
MSAKTFREERLKSIAERVMAGQAVYVNALAEEFGVSPSSIRTDLNRLEDQGILKRTHGGAILADGLDGRLIATKLPFEARQQQLQVEKEAIGRATVTLIDDGDTIMIDGGSTTVYVARHLGQKRGLTVITNAIALLPDLMAIPDAQVYVTGGLLDRGFVTLLGEVALDTIGRFRTVKVILGMDGISADAGLTVTNPAVAAIKRKMMEAGGQLVVVSDHTKLDRISLYSLAPLSAMDTLVTDAGASPDDVDAIRACGSRVIVAE